MRAGKHQMQIVQDSQRTVGGKIRVDGTTQLSRNKMMQQKDSPNQRRKMKTEDTSTRNQAQDTKN